jgi:hypothetical protein
MAYPRIGICVLNWVCLFLGFHAFGFYVHNDTMQALGRPQDMFSDTGIQTAAHLCPVDSIPAH